MFEKGKEQPDKKSRLFAGALRKTVGLSQEKCCEGMALDV
jgi:hypothetical protein